jgi:pimeloyl-ACP methyl ester carboxylesterase
MGWRIPLDVLAQQLDAMGDFPPFDPDRTRFEGPMLMVRGTKSPYVADETLPVLGRFFPRFELRDVEAGHWLISENPEAFRQGKWCDRSGCLWH